jgi:hypothetical protein
LRKKPPKPAAKRPRGRPPKPRIDPATATLPIDLPVAPRANDAPAATAPQPIILPHLAPAKVSEVYESYWRFAADRQDVFFRRARGEARPWTSNAVLTTYKFTNAYRASDRASQYLIRHVNYRADLPSSPREVFFRILLFKLFNKIETWELLERSFGSITFEDYRFARYDEVLARAMRDGHRIYSAAYIMPPGSSAFGRSAKHQNHLLLLERMMADRLPERLAQTRTMQEGFEKLRAYPTIGDFLAYQFITDINRARVLRVRSVMRRDGSAADTEGTVDAEDTLEDVIAQAGGDTKASFKVLRDRKVVGRLDMVDLVRALVPTASPGKDEEARKVA